MNRSLRAVVSVLVLVLASTGVTGCRSAHPARVPAAAKAQGRQDARLLTEKCIPSSALAQVQLAKSLASRAGREALIAKCGVPPRNRQAAETRIVSAAERPGTLTTKAGRTEFFTVALPQIIASEQS